MPPIPQREITTIVVHCSDTPNGRPQTVADIDKWHRDNGWQRGPFWRVSKGFNTNLTSIGYHYVIYVDGTVHTGRHVDEIGAHVAGHNTGSLGICMIGRDRFSPEQWASLKKLVQQLQVDIKASQHQIVAKVMGHRQFDTAIKQGKRCPNFDVPGWFQRGFEPASINILTKEATK